MTNARFSTWAYQEALNWFLNDETLYNQTKDLIARVGKTRAAHRLAIDHAGRQFPGGLTLRKTHIQYVVSEFPPVHGNKKGDTQ